MFRRDRWLPALVAALALLVTAALHSSFQIDTSASERAAGQAGCTLGPDRRNAERLPVPDPRDRKAPASAALTVVDPEPEPEVPIEEPAPVPAPTVPEPWVVDVPLGALRTGWPTTSTTGSLLLTATSGGEHRVLHWRPDAPPIVLHTQDVYIFDVAWHGRTLVVATAGDDPRVHVLDGTNPPVELAKGLWRVTASADRLYLHGAEGVRTSTRALGPAPAVDGRGLLALGDAAFLLTEADGEVALTRCVADVGCTRTWDLGAGTACGFTRVGENLAAVRHVGAGLWAHELRRGFPQGGKRIGDASSCGFFAWHRHRAVHVDTTATHAYAIDGRDLEVPVGLPTLTLHDLTGRGGPDVYASTGKAIVRVPPRGEAHEVLRFADGVVVGLVRPGD